MAVTVTLVFDGVHVKEFDVEATVDGDTTAVITHELSGIPFVTLIPLQVASRVSDWIATTITSTTIQVDATAGVGSGAAGAQLRVRAVIPNAPNLG